MRLAEDEVTEGIRGELVEAVGRHRFRLWFRDFVVSRVDGESVTLAVPTEVHRAWLQYTYGDVLREACARVLGDGVEVRLEVSGAQDGKRAVRDRLPALPEEWDALLARRRPTPSLASWVSPPGDAFAARLLGQLVHSSGETDPPSVYLYGEAGTGKTHLLQP